MGTLLSVTNFAKKLPDAVNAFAEPLIKQLSELGLISEITAIDHICYRVADLASYQVFKDLLGSIGTLLSETPINGRLIACYKLHESINNSSGFSISVVELPSPRFDVAYGEGFEHIEVVLRTPLESFLNRYSGLQFNTKNLGAVINRDISMQLPGGLVKFHETSIEEIIALEKIAARDIGEKDI